MELDIAEVFARDDGVHDGYHEHIFPMKSCKRGLANPRVKLTIYKSGAEDEEKGVLANINVTEDATGMMVLDHLAKVQEAEIAARAEQAEDGDGKEADMNPVLSEGELLASACTGYLEMLGSWG